MNDTVNKDFCPEGRIESKDGPFDVCIDCKKRAVACSGPRTTAMSHERYVTWMRRLFDKWGGTRQRLADITGVSKSTIDDLFTGRRKDISRTTAGLLEDALIGGDSKWPCAYLVDPEKEIVYEDRPETLEALRVNMEANKAKDEEIETLRCNIKEIQEHHHQKLERIRADYEGELKEYRELIAHMRSQVDRKDDYIDRLAKKLGI